MALSYPAPEQEPLPPSDSTQANVDGETGAPVGERPHAPEIKPPSGSRRVSYALFSRETRAGRFLRAMLRGFIIFASLVALGALAVYMALARPAEEQLLAVQAQATQAADNLQRAQRDRDQALQQRQDADARAEEAQQRLTLELTRIQVLRATNAIITAQVAVAEEDREEAAKALTTAENVMRQAKPRLDQFDASYSATFENLFSLTRSDLDRDLSFAAQDLERLRVELSRLDNALR